MIFVILNAVNNLVFISKILCRLRMTGNDFCHSERSEESGFHKQDPLQAQDDKTARPFGRAVSRSVSAQN